MQLILIAHGSRATLQVADVGIIVAHNQRALELPCTTGIDAEIRAEFHRAAHALGNINKGSIGEDGTIEGCKEVVLVGNHAAQILAHQVRMFPDSL